MAASGPILAIDARMLTRPLRGMPLYLLNLCRTLPGHIPHARILLFINTGFEHNVARADFEPLLREVSAPGTVTLVDIPCFTDPWWEQVLLPLALIRRKADLVFLPGNRRPYWSPCPSVVALHDVMELLFPGKLMAAPAGAGPKLRFYFWRKRFYVHSLYRYALPRADAVMTVSHHAAKDIQTHLPVDAGRITVAYHGIPEGFRIPAPLSPPRAARTHCLMLGGDSYQKNPEGAIAAWARLPQDLRRAYPLRIAGFVGGPDSPLTQALQARGLEEEVDVIPWVDEASLIELFRHAALFLFLSRHEGFGFPLVQAMAAGTPVVHSHTTSLGELGGGAGLAVNPENAGEAAEAMTQLLTDSSVWENCRQKGWAHAASFTWDRSAALHARVFSKWL